MKEIEIISDGANYTAADMGALDKINEYTFQFTPDIAIPGKLFIGEALKNTGTEVSFTVVPAGMGGDFLHVHKTNEELYIVLKGCGVFQVDNNLFEIKEGSLIRVAPGGKRSWKNTGDEPLIMICIQSLAGSLIDLGIKDGRILQEEIKW
ncbi:MAG: cupin domain-containing protein [Bacteroidales bacterium]